MNKKGMKCYFDTKLLSMNEFDFLWEHKLDINALWQENKARISSLETQCNGAINKNSILEQKIKELEAENAELKSRTNAFTYNGVASQNDATGTNAFNEENAQLTEENRKLSEANANLQNKVFELSNEVQVLQQKLSQNGGNRMSEEVTQWEYKRVNPAITEELNKLGEEGWELAGITGVGYNALASGIMKRPKKTQNNNYDYDRGY